MLPQMCELLMSFSQLATWAILPVCSWQFAAVARCRFFKFFMLQFSQIPRALHVLEHMCVTPCVCVCTLIIFTWQMLRFKCSSSSNNNSCTYAQPAQPHRAASRTGKWIQLNPSAGPILRNETVYYATYRQIRTRMLLYRTGGYRCSQNMFGHNIRLTAAAAAAALTARGMPI